MAEGYDYIVVGAGSAGCVLAEKLSQDPAIRVLLVEAGGTDRHWKLSMPAALTYPLHDARWNWKYQTEPQAALGGRSLYWPRGKVLGGSSSINGMVWIRGHAKDFDDWYNEGLHGWAFCQLLPYFKRLETAAGDPAYRGKAGAVRVAPGHYPSPLVEAWLASGQAAGFALNPDFNGRVLDGFGRYDMNIWQGRRQSSAVTHLRPAMARPNLKVMTGTLVRHLLFAGNRVTGIAYANAQGEGKAEADGEVILCGGTINSAQTLLLSGIGDADALRALSIPVRADLKGVGQNLHDHLVTSIKYECTQPVSLHGKNHFPRNVLVALEYALFKTGAGATMHQESGSFQSFSGTSAAPDVQTYFVPLIVMGQGIVSSDRHGYQAHIQPCKPYSRGTLSLRSADPRDPPALQPNALADDRDRQILRQSVRLTREVMEQAPLRPFRGRLLYPTAGTATDADIDAHLADWTYTCYHPVGTCRMGTDAGAVVDAALRVHGVANLRVADGSVFPSVPSGNINAPIMALADRIGDHILGRPALPPEDVEIAGYTPLRTAEVRPLA